jgi:hypothetical protein
MVWGMTVPAPQVCLAGIGGVGGAEECVAALALQLANDFRVPLQRHEHHAHTLPPPGFTFLFAALDVLEDIIRCWGLSIVGLSAIDDSPFPIQVHTLKILYISLRVVQFGFLGERDKVRESSRTLKLFEQFDVQFRKWRISLVSIVILVQNMLVLSYMYIIYYN